MAVNAVDYAVISQALLATAREMGVKLVRSAYSSIVRDAKDASTGVMDVTGAAVALSDELIPVLVNSLSETFRACAEVCPPDQLGPDDFYIANHPYRGGQHLQDIFVFLPIFHRGVLVGFSASVVHHIEIGGGAAGLNHSATDYYQEGLVLPPMRCNLRRDWSGGLLEQMITANVRVPEQTVGDLYAQIFATRVGERRVLELCDKYGPDLVGSVMGEMIAYSEKRVRAAIAATPDGVYRGVDYVDDDGLSAEPLRVEATVTVAGDRLTVDYTGTQPQVKTNLNAPFASTVSSTLSCLKTILTGEDVPFNEGARNAIEITAPLGTLLNPRPPAPVRARMEAIYRAFDAVMQALSQAVPDRTIAPGYDSTVCTCLTHLGEEGYQVFLEVHNGGYGGSARGDGADAVAGPLSNCTNVPTESIDMNYDYFRIAAYRLRPGSGGRGRFRGGLGCERVYEILRDGVNFAIYADRFRIPAQGVHGGEPGAPAECLVQRGNEVIPMPSKGGMDLRKGDLLILRTGGGGGFGPASGRDPADEARDRDLALV